MHTPLRSADTQAKRLEEIQRARETRRQAFLRHQAAKAVIIHETDSEVQVEIPDDLKERLRLYDAYKAKVMALIDGETARSLGMLEDPPDSAHKIRNLLTMRKDGSNEVVTEKFVDIGGRRFSPHRVHTLRQDLPEHWKRALDAVASQ